MTLKAHKSNEFTRKVVNQKRLCMSYSNDTQDHRQTKSPQIHDYNLHYNKLSSISTCINCMLVLHEKTINENINHLSIHETEKQISNKM